MNNSNLQSSISPALDKGGVSSRLYFYNRPFRRASYGTWVYDANNNFVFQFLPKYDEKGNYEEGYKEFENSVLESINSESHKPLFFNESVSICKTDRGIICINDEQFIRIRGWGNLTGVGAHNLPAEKAAKIQDDFRDWIISMLSVNGY